MEVGPSTCESLGQNADGTPEDALTPEELIIVRIDSGNETRV